MVSVPWVTTTPSARAAATPTAAAISSQSAGVSSALSVVITSTMSIAASMANPAVSSAPVRVGRLIPVPSVLVEMVPPVVMTTMRVGGRAGSFAVWLTVRIVPHQLFGMMGR